jgi:hypothetical protein
MNKIPKKNPSWLKNVLSIKSLLPKHTTNQPKSIKHTTNQPKSIGCDTSVNLPSLFLGERRTNLFACLMIFHISKLMLTILDHNVCACQCHT